MKPALSIFLMLLSAQSFAQAIFVRNHPQNSGNNTSVQIKWLCEELISDQSFNVYRREGNTGEWMLLPFSPVARLPNLAPALLQQDQELDFLVEVVNKASPDEINQDLLLLNLLLKSFQSNVFARFLGIYAEDPTASSGVAYQYRITRLHRDTEDEVGVSKVLVAGPHEKDLPVEGLEVYQDGKQIAINWEQDEERFYAVNLFQRDSLGNTSKLNERPLMLSSVADSAGNMSYPDPMFKKSGIKEGNSFTFYIEGVGYFGETTKPSEPVVLTIDDTTPPSPPYELEGKSDSLRILLQWKQDAAPDIQGFNIFRSSKSNGPFRKINDGTIPPGERVFREQIGNPGPYYYQVEVQDHSFNTSRSALAFVDVQDVIPPAVPQGLTIKADTGRFQLKWESNSEPDLLGYHVFRTIEPQGKGEFLLLNADPVDTSYFEQVIPRTVKNQFYYYVVATDTSYNRSEQSALVSAVLPDVTRPEPPVIREIHYTSEGIVLEWSPNVEADLLGYYVYRSDSVSTPSFVQQNAAILGADLFRYTDRATETNKEYLYSMQAVDSAGNYSDFSASVYAQHYVEFPPEEEILLDVRFQKRKKNLRLSWSPVSAATLRGYMIYRGTTANSMKPLTGLLKSETFYEDDPQDVPQYVYQVRAYTLSGHVIYSSKTEWRTR